MTLELRTKHQIQARLGILQTNAQMQLNDNSVFAK